MTSKHWRDIDARHCARFAKAGRELEQTVEKYLEELLSMEKVSGFTRHEPNSAEDADGRDFTVWIANGEPSSKIERSFGVTISRDSWERSKRIHPKTPQFCFPIGTNKTTMIKRILSIFEESPS
jgi:hypothetical protein